MMRVDKSQIMNQCQRVCVKARHAAYGAGAKANALKEACLGLTTRVGKFMSEQALPFLSQVRHEVNTLGVRKSAILGRRKCVIIVKLCYKECANIVKLCYTECANKARKCFQIVKNFVNELKNGHSLGGTTVCIQVKYRYILPLKREMQMRMDTFFRDHPALAKTKDRVFTTLDPAVDYINRKVTDLAHRMRDLHKTRHTSSKI